MFINFTPAGLDGNLAEIPTRSNIVSFIFSSNSELVATKKMNHFSLLNEVEDTATFAGWHNKLQKLC